MKDRVPLVYIVGVVIGFAYVFIGAIHGIATIFGSRIACGWFCGDDTSGIEYFLVTALWPLTYF